MTLGILLVLIWGIRRSALPSTRESILAMLKSRGSLYRTMDGEPPWSTLLIAYQLSFMILGKCAVKGKNQQSKGVKIPFPRNDQAADHSLLDQRKPAEA